MHNSWRWWIATPGRLAAGIALALLFLVIVCLIIKLVVVPMLGPIFSIVILLAVLCFALTGRLHPFGRNNNQGQGHR